MTDRIGAERDLLDELDQLRHRLERTEADLAELRAARAAADLEHRRAERLPRSGSPTGETGTEPVSDRRSLLAKAGTVAGIAAAGLAGAVATASPAAAANGDPLTMGATNVASARTRAYNPITVSDHLFEYSDSAGLTSEASGLATLVGAAEFYPIGVLGHSTDLGGTGVLGRSTGENSYGVRAIATGSGSAGAYASGNTGSWAAGISQGVHAEVAPGGTAIYATGGTRGVAVNGATYPLAIPPNGAGTTSPGGAAATGDVYVDSLGTLYHCVAGGTPGSWRRLSGPGTSGAFTAINPVRVHDSRLAGGHLAGGQNRTVSVADGIDPFTGTVTVPDAVPSGATAISYNLSIAETQGSGYLQVAPGNAVAITGSSINWTATGQIIANGLTVKLGPNRQVKVFAAGNATQFIIDILGYHA